MKEIVWATQDGCQNFIDGQPLTHWSRKFEYPYVLRNASLEPHQVTLDAAGGDAPLQWHTAPKTGVLFNIDLDVPALERGKKQYGRNNIIYQTHDLKTLGSEGGRFCEGFFDRVLCISVLEHDPGHMDLLKELWWVLKPGGRLVLTFDVASYSRWNHSIDLARAVKIAAMFDLEMPEQPKDILKAVFPEIDRKFMKHQFDWILTCNHCGIAADKQGDHPYCPKLSDPESVELKVLCLIVDKE